MQRQLNYRCALRKADNKTARRFAIMATEMLIKKNVFSQFENLNFRMIAIAKIERAFYSMARNDRNLEMEITEEELRLIEKKVYDFDCLRLSIENNIAINEYSDSFQKFYEKTKKELMDGTRNSIDGKEIDGMAGDQQQTVNGTLEVGGIPVPQN